jgi:hypothetical protein
MLYRDVLQREGDPLSISSTSSKPKGVLDQPGKFNEPYILCLSKVCRTEQFRIVNRSTIGRFSRNINDTH